MAQAAVEGPVATRQGWILDPRRDLVFFLATPLLVVAVAALARLQWSVGEIAALVAVVGANGHHLPGWMRAYGDRELFARFRWRFTVAPVLFIGVSVAFAHTDLKGLATVVLVWGLWHGMAQVYGFCRIYDAKIGDDAPLTAQLDRWMLITWFGSAVLHSPGRLAQILDTFYVSGGPVLSGSTLGGITGATDTLTAAVTLAFAANLLVAWRRGRPPSALKLAMLNSSIAFWWYAMVFIDDTILGVALFEVFHDVQYLAITWSYNQRVVDRGHRVGRFTRFLFRSRPGLALLYVGLVFAYGGVTLLPDYAAWTGLQPTLIGIVAASSLLHFYYDGFIWKVRENRTREGLDVGGGESIGPESAKPGWAHAALFALFLVPVAWLAYAQAHLARPLLDQKRSLAEIAPRDFSVQLNLGSALYSAGDLDAAAHQYRRAKALAPDHAGVAMLLGDVYLKQARFVDAADSYSQALELDPRDARAHRQRGTALLALGQYREAEAALERALALDPNDADTHANLAALAQHDGRHDDARSLLARALVLDPDIPEANAALGLLLEDSGELEAAERLLARAVAHSRDVGAEPHLRRVRASLDRAR